MDAVDARKLQRAQARVGEVLRGKWHLDQLLGVGGMASVYAATHRNGKRGALKMLHLEWVNDEDASARFLREGHAANTVDHPGVVSVLDDDVAEDGSVFLVMELLEGETVEARANARPGQRLEVPEVVAIADLLLDVLAAAHDKGIIHRDIKPANLFVTPKGQLKVLDFGIARVLETKDSGKTTQEGSAIGTPAFMAQEQARGYWDQVDARTDLWAVGATMFTLLTGRQVHQAETVQTLMLAAMTKPAPRISSVLPSLPTMLGPIIDRALAFEQADRWPDARSMQRALRELPDSLAPDPSPLLALYGARLSTPPALASLSLPSSLSRSSPLSSSSYASGLSQPMAPPGMMSMSQAAILPIGNERERSSGSGGKIVTALLAVFAVIAGGLFVMRSQRGASQLGRPTVSAAPDTPTPAKPTESSSATVATAKPTDTPSTMVAPVTAAPTTATANATDAVKPPPTPSSAASMSSSAPQSKPFRPRTASPSPAPPPKALAPRPDPLDKF